MELVTGCFEVSSRASSSQILPHLSTYYNPFPLLPLLFPPLSSRPILSSNPPPTTEVLEAQFCISNSTIPEVQRLLRFDKDPKDRAISGGDCSGGRFVVSEWLGGWAGYGEWEESLRTTWGIVDLGWREGRDGLACEMMGGWRDGACHSILASCLRRRNSVDIRLSCY